ncbi:hypothetical protein P7K49_002570 [Saguinus oedipus]|uniref:Uncharacterized protein n=1 Tax=Saguinus oedipus TaxID=9490 RepID=A0ABQ9WHQ8_SAGOE|nr:hypothetical protein P7K49_002570 [Saguinus oedipus]
MVLANRGILISPLLVEEHAGIRYLWRTQNEMRSNKANVSCTMKVSVADKGGGKNRGEAADWVDECARSSGILPTCPSWRKSRGLCVLPIANISDPQVVLDQALPHNWFKFVRDLTHWQKHCTITSCRCDSIRPIDSFHELFLMVPLLLDSLLGGFSHHHLGRVETIIRMAATAHQLTRLHLPQMPMATTVATGVV